MSCAFDIVLSWFSELNAYEQRSNELSATEMDSLARRSKTYVANTTFREIGRRVEDFENVRMPIPHLRMMVAKMIVHEYFENAEELCASLEAGEGDKVSVYKTVLRPERKANPALTELFQVFSYLK